MDGWMDRYIVWMDGWMDGLIGDERGQFQMNGEKREIGIPKK